MCYVEILLGNGASRGWLWVPFSETEATMNFGDSCLNSLTSVDSLAPWLDNVSDQNAFVELRNTCWLSFMARLSVFQLGVKPFESHDARPPS
jgi:hypothetical protein